MPWARFDDRFPSNRKIRKLSDAAFRLYVSAVCWSGENLTDGFVADDDLMIVSDVRDPESAAEELVRRELWESVPGGWVIHDYFDYNPRAAQVRAEREAKSARQQRWREGKRGTESGSDVDASTGTSTDASVERNTQRATTGGAKKGRTKTAPLTDSTSIETGKSNPSGSIAGVGDVDASTDASRDGGVDASVEGAPRARVPVPSRSPTTPLTPHGGGGGSEPYNQAAKILATLQPAYLRPGTGARTNELTDAIAELLSGGAAVSAIRGDLEANPLPRNQITHVAGYLKSRLKSPAAYTGATGRDTIPGQRGDSKPLPDWCGQCNQTTRCGETPEGLPYRCPDCHPVEVARKEAAA